MNSDLTYFYDFCWVRGIEYTLLSQKDEGKIITSVVRIDSGMIRSTINRLGLFFDVSHDGKNFRVTISEKKKYNDKGLDKIDKYMVVRI